MPECHLKLIFPALGNNTFYFLLPLSRESIIFGSHFRSGDFDGYTHSQKFFLQFTEILLTAVLPEYFRYLTNIRFFFLL